MIKSTLLNIAITVIRASDCFGQVLDSHLSLLTPMTERVSGWTPINSSFFEVDKAVLTLGGSGRAGVGILKNTWQFESEDWEMEIDLEAIDLEDSGGATTYANFNIFFHAVDTSHEMFLTRENCLGHGSSTVISHTLISVS